MSDIDTMSRLVLTSFIINSLTLLLSLNLNRFFYSFYKGSIWYFIIKFDKHEYISASKVSNAHQKNKEFVPAHLYKVYIVYLSLKQEKKDINNLNIISFTPLHESYTWNLNSNFKEFNKKWMIASIFNKNHIYLTPLEHNHFSWYK